MTERAPLAAGGRLTLVAVHAHPDDETLATGVALAHHVAAGHDVHVVTCTLGEEGEVIPPELADLEGTDRLGPYRHGELAAAMRVLGVTHHYLGGDPPRWRDSGMAGSPAASHADAFAGADLTEAGAVLRELLHGLAPDVVLTYDSQGGYGHPDHIQTHRVTCAAVAGMEPSRRPALYAVLTPRSWAEEDRHWLAEHVAAGGGEEGATIVVPRVDEPYAVGVVADELVTHAVQDRSVLAVQAEALRCHATQVTVHDGFYTLSNDVASRLAGREGYALLDPATGEPAS